MCALHFIVAALQRNENTHAYTCMRRARWRSRVCSSRCIRYADAIVASHTDTNRKYFPIALVTVELINMKSGTCVVNKLNGAGLLFASIERFQHVGLATTLEMGMC